MIQLHVQGKRFDAELWVEDGWIYVRTPYDPDLLEEVKSLQGRRWDPDARLWRAKDVPRNRFALRLLARDPLVQARYDAPLEPVVSHRALFDAQARLMVPHLVQRRQALLAAEMRTGKTLAVLEAMERVACERWWWVGPAKTMGSTQALFERWEAEVVPERWLSYDHLRLHLHDLLQDGPPQGIVFDESVALKNPTSSRSQVALELRELLDQVHGDDAFVWLLSGYPAPQDPTDWWGQVEIARPGFLKEPSKQKLLERLAELEKTDVGGVTHQKVARWREAELKLLARRLEGLVLRVERKDCYDVPARRYVERELKPTLEQLELARRLVELSGSVGSALAELRELSDGFQYVQKDGKRVAVYGETPKDDALRGYLTQAENRIAVYAGFTASVDRVTSLCMKAGWSVLQCDGRKMAFFGEPARAPVLATFQDVTAYPEKIAFVAQPGAGGKGLDLTAADHEVFFSNDFNGDAREQAEARLIGPNVGPKTIVDLFCLGSDKYVMRRLKEKGTLAGATLEDLREALG